MPSGRTHDRITLWSLPWVVLLSFLLARNGELTLIVAASYLFSGLMFGPDLDIHSVQFKRWGVFRRIWLPYQKTLSHRSWFSHGPIIGTTVRVLYFLCLLFLVAILVVAIAQLFIGFAWNWQTFFKNLGRWIAFDYRSEAIALFLGLELGAMSHSLSDWIGSSYKRYQRQGWKGVLPKSKKKRSQKRSPRQTNQKRSRSNSSGRKTRK